MTEPVVTVQEGQLKGKIAEDYKGGLYFSFLGIPYAKSPIGDLRFKAPVPAEPWTGVFDATKEGNSCPASHMFFKYYTGSEENCLNLNIHTRELPKSGKNTLKPVMVWIHGGAFLFGSNKSEFFGPDYLITEDIVLILINYRLGILGFLSLEDPSLGVPGNAGMKDMVLALKWVQKNIHNFMGDPSNVTIFGESAGGAAIHYLILSPLAKGLFHKAIAQSGCTLNCWAKCKSNGREVAKYLGYKETDEKKILEYLKKIPPKKLINAQSKQLDNFTPNDHRVFGPVVEKPSSEPAFLIEDPINILKTGSFNHVPLIMGYNSNEGLLFEIVKKIRPSVKITTDFETEIPLDLNLKKGSEKSLEVAQKIKHFYFGKEEPSNHNIHKLHMLKGDHHFVYGIHKSIYYQKMNSTTPIYLYKMSLETSLNYYKKISVVKSVGALFFCYFLSHKSGENGFTKSTFLKLSNSLPNKDLPGVCHGDDLAYLFKSFLNSKIESDSIEDISIRRFVKMWTNFARFGNPTADAATNDVINVHWKPVEKDQLHCLDIGKELKLDVDPDIERIKFWDSLYSEF